MEKMPKTRITPIAAFWALLGLSLLPAACNPRQDFDRLPLEGKSGFNVVITTPAGNNELFSWDSQKKAFMSAGQINLLPCPVNLGFLPGWSGQGSKPLVAVIAENTPQGTVMEASPLALLRLRTGDGQIIPVLIAYPAKAALRVIRATTFRAFLIEYDATKRILETWFQHYQGFGRLELANWEDEAFALRYIRGEVK